MRLEEYVKKGWYIFPVRKNEKTPLIAHDWREVSTNELSKIAAWAIAYPGCNWAVDCIKSGIVVADVDFRNVARFPVGQASFVVTTPSGGRHAYFNRTSTGERPACFNALPRGDSPSYALLPGSFVKGKGYKVLYDKDAPPADSFPRTDEIFFTLLAEEDLTYAKLTGVLNSALEQASKGKGKERHGNGKAFDEQPICVISQLLEKAPGKTAGPAFQAIKKIVEAGGMKDKGAAIRELYGAINYTAAMIILLSEED